MTTHIASRDDELITEHRVQGRQTKSNCRCRGARPLPDRTAFLGLLAPRHLEDLAQQCGLEPAQKGEDPSSRAVEIARFLEANPGKTIRLRNTPKRRSASSRPPYQLEKEGRYLLGMLGSSIWDIGVKRFNGQSQRQLALRDDLPFSIEIDFGLSCALQNTLFGVRLVVEEDFSIPEGVTMITDLPAIRFEQRLSMGRNARLYGTHRCGLRVEADHLRGSGVGTVPGSPAMEEWPIISTSIRPLDEQVFNYVLENEDYANLWRLTSGQVIVDGTSGERGESLSPRSIAGAKGADGNCDWWGLGGHTDPGNGEDHAGRQGLPGGDGGPGEDGHSPASLTVLIHSTYDGHMRFEARGGNGGNGGQGGDGQHLQSGVGGDVSSWCAGATKPGLGGSQGAGGNAGRGGAGGSGGSGGTIRLSFPSLPDEKTYCSCVCKGAGGRAGSNGTVGQAYRGNPGRWLDPFTNEPGAMETPADYWENSPPVPGAVPDNSPVGQEGWNGSIYVNGELKVATNQGNTPNDFRYPVGSIVAGAENKCWG